MSPIPVGFRYFLHEIGPMTRNPERDTECSRVVRARSPSLALTGMESLICVLHLPELNELNELSCNVLTYCKVLCYFNQGKVKGEVSDKVRSRDSRARGDKGSGVRLQKLRHRKCSGEI